ncbi:putative Ig domain-containing protein [uncultured Sphingomonas sp.]|uniref:Ig-like domain-containing protein n=1 Tax=uncultured Sphingomonas sp. TaxID=158754 RepID=UPI0025E17C85|nr:putative Ig domain-containing protein [uncultured Sphingomonas sp.]
MVWGLGKVQSAYGRIAAAVFSETRHEDAVDSPRATRWPSWLAQRKLRAAVAGGMFVFAPAHAFAASAACNEINTFSRTYTVDAAGNPDYNFTSQPLVNGETVTYSWSGNTQGAHVFVTYTQNNNTTYAPDSLQDSTATSGSGSFTFTGTSSVDNLQLGLSSYDITGNNTNPVPYGSARSVQINISCSSGTTLGVTMSHSGNAVQGGSLAYTITPSVSGGATTSATLTATFTLPSGMTYSSASGSGWSCSGSGQSGSCSRTTGFSAGSGPTITLNANFASNASSPLTPSVQLSGGGASNTASYSDSTVVVATPTVTSISPASGSTAGGTSVVITGTNLSGATGVVFGATAAAGYTVNNATQITATSPAGTGTVDVRVTTAAGTSATSAADQFTYVSAPVASAYTAPAVAYGATGATFSLAGQVTNSPTAYAVGSATTANGGSVSISNVGLVTYSAPAHYRGNDSFTYTASNGAGTSAPATVTVPVSNPTLSASLTGSGTRGSALSGVQIVTTGGSSPYSCSTTLASGALPAGTQLNTNCTITGTPTASGTFSFTANVTDSSTPSGFTQATGSLSLVIASPTLTLSPAAGALPAATAGTSYSQSFTAGSGTAPYSYAITAGTLPAGLILSGSTLTGTPSQTGTFNFTVTATDSASAGSGGPYSVSKSYSVTVGAPTIALTPTTLTGATAGVAYSQTITASGGVSPYTYSVTAGALPAGLTLSSSGTLSGTPSAGGTFNFTVTATDSSSGAGAPFSANRAYSLTVAAATITITPTSLSPWAAGAPYSQTLTASGGNGAYTFAVTAGALPPGWTLSSSGVLSGTATASNNYNFTVTATDQSTGAGAPYSASQAYTAIVTTPIFSLDPTTPLSGTVGQAYTGGFVAGGGTAPYTYDVFSGTLPPGLSLGTGGTLSGTPTTAGTFSFIVRARDTTSGLGAPYAVIENFSFTVSPPSAPTTGPVSATVAYNSSATSITLALSGPTATSVAVVTPPAHGTATVNGLAIEYTPTADYYGADSFTYTATNSGGTSAQATVSITVSTPAAPTAANRSGVAIPYNSGGTAIDLSTSISGVHTSITVATAPAHGTTSVAGDVVTYTPTAGYDGADSFTYTATGPGGTSAPATVGLVVATPAAPTVADRSGVEVPTGSTGTAIDLSSSITGVHTSIAVVTAPTHGTTTVAGDIVTYIPTAGYMGADSFTYTATGPGGTSAPGTVSINVTTPAAPTVADRSGVTVAYNSPGAPIDLTASVSGVYTSIAVATAPAHGSTTVSGNVVTYIPNSGSFGPDSFTYTATGPGGTSTPATVNVTVATPPPPAAVPGNSAVPAATTAQPGSTSEIDLSALVNGNFTSIEIQTPPSHGTLTLRTITASPAGGGVRPLAVTTVTAVYTPAINYTGPDSFSFVAVGPGGRSAPAAVTIQVVAPLPQALPKTAETGDGQRVSVDLTAGATNGPFTGAAVVSMTPADAAVTQVVASGSGASQAYRLDIVPAARFGGKIVIQYTLSNAFGTSAPATVTVTVAARPDPTLDPNVRGLSDAQAEAARRFGRAQVSNFMRRTEQLHNGGGSGKPQMGISLASQDQHPVVRGNPAFDSYATAITERMRMSGEDPALGAIARRKPSAPNGAGASGTVPGNLSRTAMASTPAGAAATGLGAAPGNDDGDGGDGTRRKGSVALWSGGAIDIGTQDATSDRAKITATTSGLSTGADIKLAEGVLFGIGGGYSNDVSRIGGSAARVRSESRLVAAYASLMPVDGTFVDGMVGFGDLSFSTRRLEGTTNATAVGNRNGNFTLGAVSLGIDREGGPLRWSLYARGEFLRANLDGYTESGAGRMDLRFDSRDVHSLTGTLGARLEMERRYGEIRMTPRLRFEWNHELQDAAAQRLDYADIPGEAFYSISTFGWSRNQYQLSLGTRMLLPSDWTVDFEGGYRGGGREMAGTLRVLIGKEF